MSTEERSEGRRGDKKQYTKVYQKVIDKYPGSWYAQRALKGQQGEPTGISGPAIGGKTNPVQGTEDNAVQAETNPVQGIEDNAVQAETNPVQGIEDNTVHLKQLEKEKKTPQS